MASQDCVTNDAPVFSSSFGYWNEVPKGAVLVPHWQRQNPPAAQPDNAVDVRPGGLPDRQRP
jgi:hypothetical protein